MSVDIVQIIATAVITGGISCLGTVKALGVHIEYLGKAVERLDSAVTRAHQRIDNTEGKKT